MAQTVLIADDSIASQRLFEMVLTREGYDVVTVGSGKEVFQHVKEKHPDLALIDAIMPEVDGYQICQSLKQDPQFKNLPVIMLGGTHEDFDKEKGANIVGPNAILNKPSKSHIIISKVKEFLQQQQDQEEPEASLAEEYAEVIQEEPTFVEEEYEFDEDSEEADLVVESEILDEDAEWAETEEEATFPVEESSEKTPESAAIKGQAAGGAPSPATSISTGEIALSEESLDLIADEIAKRLTGKLAPVIMQSLATYLLKNIVDTAGKDLVKEILPEIQKKLK